MSKEKGTIHKLLHFLNKSVGTQNDTHKNIPKEEIISGQPYLPKVGKSHTVAGLYYHEDSVMKLAHENPNYNLSKDAIIKKGYSDITLYQYTFTNEPVTLEKEPNNPKDPNAIKVIVAGEHIGYIKAGSCAQVNKLINDGRIENIICRISGGPHKTIRTSVNDNPNKKTTYHAEQGTNDLRAEIRIISTND